MVIQDLGFVAYRDAWALQERVHAEVVAGGEERLLLVEHPPVVTFGRRANVERNLIGSETELAKLGVEIVQSDRGGDITFHGPGQLVVYPIVRLADHRLLVGSYVRRLLDVVIATLKEFGIEGRCDPSAVGVWAGEADRAAKVCAVGVRVRRGVSMHGIALNVTTDLRYFELIVPCGLAGRAVTSMERLLPAEAISMDAVKQAFVKRWSELFDATPGQPGKAECLAAPRPA
jgi:lipoyl(octanoyl) transferase